jgi:deoxyribose-phosphate aldolase
MSSTLLTQNQAQQPTPSDWRSIARTIDHTLLRADATRTDIERLCREAAHFGFAAVFVPPTHLALAVALLRDSPVRAGTPVGFPLGAALTTVKIFETEEALRIGADELDMVMNVSAMKSGDRGLVEQDVRAVVKCAHDAGAIVKVILETSLLSLDEKLAACQLALVAGADYVKTSTGFAGGGATVDDVILMRGVVGHKMGVKAAGGIRTAADVLAMLDAGADRIGTSTATAIMRELGAPEL